MRYVTCWVSTNKNGLQPESVVLMWSPAMQYYFLPQVNESSLHQLRFKPWTVICPLKKLNSSSSDYKDTFLPTKEVTSHCFILIFFSISHVCAKQQRLYFLLNNPILGTLVSQCCPPINLYFYRRKGGETYLGFSAGIDWPPEYLTWIVGRRHLLSHLRQQNIPAMVQSWLKTILSEVNSATSSLLCTSPILIKKNKPRFIKLQPNLDFCKTAFGRSLSEFPQLLHVMEMFWVLSLQYLPQTSIKMFMLYLLLWQLQSSLKIDTMEIMGPYVAGLLWKHFF